MKKPRNTTRRRAATEALYTPQPDAFSTALTSPPAPAAPPAHVGPVENGQRLATLPRGMSEELRVNWAAYNGHHFLALRVWHCGMDGVWRPDRMRGCTVKLRELPVFADAVQAALDLATADG
jgi:hypothetical protein